MFNNDGTSENEAIEEMDIFGAEPSDYDEVEDEGDLCDCDPKHKESQTVQQSAGASFGGFGGQMGDGTTVIICTKCGGRFYEDQAENQRGNGFDPLF